MAMDPTVIIEDARTFAADSLEEATGLVDDAQQAITYYPSYDPKLVDRTIELVDVNDVEAPLLPGIERPVKPDMPDRPEFTALNDIDELTLRDAPTPIDYDALFDYARPNAAKEFTDQVPDIDTDVTLPAVPELSTVTAPEFLEIAISDAPSVVLPDADLVSPSFDEDAPDVSGEAFEAEYKRVLPELLSNIEGELDRFIAHRFPEHANNLALLETHLEDVMSGSRSALSDDIEQKIYDRQRARIDGARRNAIEGVIQSAARRGFVIPSGASTQGILAAERTAALEQNKAATDVAIEKAKTELQHLQFVLSANSEMRRFAISSGIEWAKQTVALNAMAMQFAKDVLDKVVEAFNLKVRLFEAELDEFKARASLVELKLKAALAQYDLYNAQIKGELAKAQVNELEVRKYTAQLDGQKTTISLYLAQLDGVAKEVDLRKIPLEIFGERVKAYAAYVGGKNAEIGAYSAALKGDAAKVQGYAAVVDAYRTENQARLSQVEVQGKVNDGRVQYNKNLTDLYRADLAGVGAEMGLSSEQLKADVTNVRVLLDRYTTDIRAEVALHGQKLAATTAQAQLGNASDRNRIDWLLGIAGLDLRRHRNIADLAMAGANAHGGMAKSALGSQNTMISQAAEVITSGA